MLTSPQHAAAAAGRGQSMTVQRSTHTTQVVLDSLGTVEDTKGNNGKVGVLYSTIIL